MFLWAARHSISKYFFRVANFSELAANASIQVQSSGKTQPSAEEEEQQEDDSDEVIPSVSLHEKCHF